MSTDLDTISELDFDTSPLLCEVVGGRVTCHQTNPAAYIVGLHCNRDPILFCEPCMTAKLSWTPGILCPTCGATAKFPNNYLLYKSITKI